MVEENIQLNLVFDYPQFETLKEAVVYSIGNCGKPQRQVAAELDYSPPEFNRILGSEEHRYFPVEKLAQLLTITGDYTPLYWLISKFLKPMEEEEKRQFQEFKKLKPQIQKLLKKL